MTRRYSLGIDPGAKGAFVLLDETGKIIRSEVFPTVDNKLNPHRLWQDLKVVVDWITDHGRLEDVMVYVEQVASMPNQSAQSGFTFGMGCGWIEMAIIALGLRYQRVKPQMWQKTAHHGIAKAQYADPKHRSLIAAQRLWPAETFLATSKSRVAHDGLVDAALIAWYGLQKDVGALTMSA